MKKMTEREVHMAHARLCSRARAGTEYRPEECQRCESSCRYGEQLLDHYGLPRAAKKPERLFEDPKDGPGPKIRRIIRGHNARSVVK